MTKHSNSRHKTGRWVTQHNRYSQSAKASASLASAASQSATPSAIGGAMSTMGVIALGMVACKELTIVDVVHARGKELAKTRGRQDSKT
jgi:hypothetical protein